MSALLELLGKGLEPHLMSLVLPQAEPLAVDDAKVLADQVTGPNCRLGDKLRLAVHYCQCGASDRAERIFEEIQHDRPEDIDSRLACAAMHASEGSFEKAIEQLELLPSNALNDMRVLFALGYCHELTGDIDQAVRYYDGPGCKGHFRRSIERLAAIHLYQDDHASAIACYLDLKDKYPEDVSNYLTLGQLYIHTGEHRQAIAVFERALTIEPDNFEMHDDTVESLANSGRLVEAIEQLKQLSTQQADFPDTYVRIADLYSELGDDDEAVSNYSRALSLHPAYLEAAVKLGTQHLRMGRYLEAASNFTRAVEMNDRLILSYVALAVSQRLAGDKLDAEDTLDLACALEPNTNLLFAEVVRLQMKVSLSRNPNAGYSSFDADGSTHTKEMDDLLALQIERHHQCLLENPTRADLHYRYAVLLAGRGRTDQAISHLETAVQINPSYSKAKIKLGLALREAERYDDSIEQLTDALRLTEEYRDLHYKVALLQCDKIHFAMAMEKFSLLSEQPSDDTSVEANITLLLQNMGLIDRAQAVWRSVCELDPQSLLAFQSQRSITPIRTLH